MYVVEKDVEKEHSADNESVERALIGCRFSGNLKTTIPDSNQAGRKLGPARKRQERPLLARNEAFTEQQHSSFLSPPIAIDDQRAASFLEPSHSNGHLPRLEYRPDDTSPSSRLAFCNSRGLEQGRTSLVERHRSDCHNTQ